MARITMKDGLLIRGLSGTERRAVETTLTYKNPKYVNALKFSGLQEHQITKIPPVITLYDYEDGVLRVPRGYRIPASLKAARKRLRHAKITDKRVTAKVTVPYPKPLFKPYPQQQKALDALDIDVRNPCPTRPNGNYLFVLEVSAGKTMLAIMMAMRLKQRCLVLVHTSVIMKVWIDDLCKLFGEEYRKEIGIIQGGKAKIGPHFTIAMAQTWFKREEHWQDWWKHFGTMLFDEAHVCMARTFNECAFYCPSKYIIGLTGTDKRKDGMHKLMYGVFGQRFYHWKPVGQDTATSIPVTNVFFKDTKAKLPDKIPKKLRFRIKGKTIYKTVMVKPDGNIDSHAVFAALGADKERAKQIAEDVIKEYKASPRNSCLVVAKQKVILLEVRKQIRKLLKKRVAVLFGGSSLTKNGKIIDKIKARQIRMTVSTNQYIQVGASINPLNRLFIASPMGNDVDLEQLCGRIRRRDPKKKDALVYYYVDKEIPYCLRHYVKHAIPVFRDKLGVTNLQRIWIG